MVRVGPGELLGQLSGNAILILLLCECDKPRRWKMEKDLHTMYFVHSTPVLQYRLQAVDRGHPPRHDGVSPCLQSALIGEGITQYY